MPRLALLVISLVAVVGCKQANPSSCELPGNAGMAGCPDARSGGLCAKDTDCGQLTPACNTVKGECVVCTAQNRGTCGMVTPKCENDACTACVDDMDCSAEQGTALGSGVCLPTGACAAPPYLYVAGTGVGTTCSLSSPCSLDAALMRARSPGEPTIVKAVAGTEVFTAASDTGFAISSPSDHAVTLDLLGSTLNPKKSGSPVVTVTGFGEILNAKISGASGATGDGIYCDGGTLTARDLTITGNANYGINTSNCVLKLSRSRIGPSNQNGGINVINGKFVIVGNIIMENGGDTSPNPGVLISAAFDPANRLEFNTIASNGVDAGVTTAGVDCKPSTFIASNNIIWGNTVKNSANPSQTGNNCAHTYSAIGPTATAGTGNTATNPNLTPDGHLVNLSLTKQAEATADLTGPAERDIDKQRRISPADIGADQLPR
jgi:hypothetical protein